MAKGFVIGAIWGGVVAVGGAGVLSVMNGPVGQPGLPGGAGGPDAPVAVTELGEADAVQGTGVPDGGSAIQSQTPADGAAVRPAENAEPIDPEAIVPGGADIAVDPAPAAEADGALAEAGAGAADPDAAAEGIAVAEPVGDPADSVADAQPDTGALPDARNAEAAPDAPAAAEDAAVADPIPEVADNADAGDADAAPAAAAGAGADIAAEPAANRDVTAADAGDADAFTGEAIDADAIADPSDLAAARAPMADAPAPEAEQSMPAGLAVPDASGSPEVPEGTGTDPRPLAEAVRPLPSDAPDSAAQVPPQPGAQVRAGTGDIDLALAPSDDGEAFANSPLPVDEVDRATPPTSVPDPAADVPLGGAETDPPADPAVGAAPDAPGVAEPGEAEEIAIAALEPVSPTGQGLAPGAPDPDSEPQVSADPGLPPEPAPEATATPDVQAIPDAQREPAAQPVPDAQAILDAQPDGQEPPDAQDAEEPGRLQTRAGSLVGNREPAVQQNRLPSIAAPEPEAAEPAPEEAETAVAGLPDSSPLVRNAASAKAPDGVPRMAVVLIDDGAGPLGPEALESFPFPVTFALAPGHPDPQRAAAAYRALGFEVMVVGAVPEGAQPSDVEVALGGALNAVPQAVGVLEDSTGSLQSSRAVAEQATEILRASGHGLIMVPKGLNTAQKLALKEGVPSASLFRDFDAGGESADVIRRIFDQAAFRARQEGAVVMVGRLRADTVSALVLWGLQDRGSEITLVPVSTVLTESLRAVE